MEKTNVLLFITPKTELACLYDDMNMRQALEKMRAHGYMAIPVISKTGEYKGTITEGDLLWKIVDEELDMEAIEDVSIEELVRKDYTPPIKVDADVQEVAKMLTGQNFAPVIDDRNILMGIVTRKKVLQHLLKNEA